MKTLSEYETERIERLAKMKEFNIQRNMERFIDLACDHCGTELVGENVLLMSSPPQQNIRCPSCGWQGRRFV